MCAKRLKGPFRIFLPLKKSPSAFHSPSLGHRSGHDTGCPQSQCVMNSARGVQTRVGCAPPLLCHGHCSHQGGRTSVACATAVFLGDLWQCTCWHLCVYVCVCSGGLAICMQEAVLQVHLPAVPCSEKSGSRAGAHIYPCSAHLDPSRGPGV